MLYLASQILSASGGWVGGLFVVGLSGTKIHLSFQLKLKLKLSLAILKKVSYFSPVSLVRNLISTANGLLKWMV